MVLAAIAGPVSAGNPRNTVIGGGDNPGVVVVQSPEDIAINRWKAEEAARLRAAAAAATPRSGPQPAMPAPPCGTDCPPAEFILESYARQQHTWYYCGPASAQVVINRTRGYVFASVDGQSTATNYRAQSTIAAFMGTDADGSTAGMVRNGLNQYADLDASGRLVPFTILEDIASGSDFHWAMVTATWALLRGAAVPVQMTFSSQHLVSWTSSSWWNNHRSTTVRHWISVYGYSGFWDGTYGPKVLFTDSAGGYGGQTGKFQNASRLVFNLNQANSARIVY